MDSKSSFLEIRWCSAQKQSCVVHLLVKYCIYRQFHISKYPIGHTVQECFRRDPISLITPRMPQDMNAVLEISYIYIYALKDRSGEADLYLFNLINLFI